jgi:hypothetical protein
VHRVGVGVLGIHFQELVFIDQLPSVTGDEVTRVNLGVSHRQEQSIARIWDVGIFDFNSRTKRANHIVTV